MPIPLRTRLYRRLRRSVGHRWQGLAVTVRGNRVARRLDFDKEIPHPILLLQGFGSTRHGLMVLEKRLRAEGYDVFSIRLGGLFGTLNTKTIDRLAHLVAEKVVSLRARYRLGKLTIIGHSKGGLVGRYFVSCLHGDAHCHTLITLGTPHQGLPVRQLTRVAALGLVLPSLRQMRPASRFFQKLLHAELPGDVRYVSIYSDTDRVTPPPLCNWSAAAPAAPVNIELSGLSHTDYLVKHRAYEAIAQFLPTM